MPKTINWAASATLAGGPNLSVASTIEIDAIDSVDITVEEGASDKLVQLQPTTTPGRVKFLMIKSSEYGSALTYKVNADDNPDIPLDHPQVFSGEGAVGALDPGKSPSKFYFSNTLGEDVEIQILVGRDSTP